MISFIKNNYDIEYVDMITVPGPDKILSESEDGHEINAIKNKVFISRDSHGSKLIFIAGHYDCAGNPCEEEKHLRQIKKAIGNVKEWIGNSEIYGIWVDKDRKVFLIEDTTHASV